MKFRRFKHKMYDNQAKKWVSQVIYYIHFIFITGETSNIISFKLPESDPENTWTIIPTFTYHHDLSILPGPSFTLKLKWLKWDVLTIKWTRGYKDTEEFLDEEVTAAPKTYLDQETWMFR